MKSRRNEEDAAFEEAVNDYKKLSYDLAKLVSQLGDIQDRVKYINEKMNWDTLVNLDFSDAMCSLAKVQASLVRCANEDDYRESDVSRLKSELEAYEREA